MTPPKPGNLPEPGEAIAATLAHVKLLGWTMAAARAGLADLGGRPEDAASLFPRGAADLLDAFAALADDWMAADAAAADMAGLRTTGRVRAVILLRLARLRPHREAVRRAAGHPVQCAVLKRTIDAIWHTAGDALDGPSRHTKRVLLGAVYASTLLIWLREAEGGEPATAAFLDRRLADIRKIGEIRARFGNIFQPRPSAV